VSSATAVKPLNLAKQAARIGHNIAGPAADDVDRQARFPHEAIDALRSEQLLSAFVPAELGGANASLADVAEATAMLARHCASTGMIFAMHQMQVACLTRHGRSPQLLQVLEELVDRQLLLASGTTELGVGGDIRTSLCAVNEHDGRFRLEKQAPVISYGNYADGILATARRSADSPSSDQVLVLCRPPGLFLEETSGWDTFGFRGTCSPGFRLSAEGDSDCIFSDPFADIATQTMLPVSHVLWSAVWLGIARAAVDRARHFVQSGARKQPGVTPPGALRLAELSAVQQQMADLVWGSARRFDDRSGDPDARSSMNFAISMNSLKVSSSTLVVDIVRGAMTICGMAGYREDSPYSLGRLFRDACGAALMVNNDRILANNAQLLLVAKDD
jgi:acyl-CoA dehydrogenase